MPEFTLTLDADGDPELSPEQAKQRWGEENIFVWIGGRGQIVNQQDNDGVWEPTFDGWLRWTGYRLRSIV